MCHFSIYFVDAFDMYKMVFVTFVYMHLAAFTDRKLPISCFPQRNIFWGKDQLARRYSFYIYENICCTCVICCIMLQRMYECTVSLEVLLYSTW